jgi:hypothetical protein
MKYKLITKQQQRIIEELRVLYALSQVALLKAEKKLGGDSDSSIIVDDVKHEFGEKEPHYYADRSPAGFGETCSICGVKRFTNEDGKISMHNQFDGFREKHHTRRETTPLRHISAT